MNSREYPSWSERIEARHAELEQKLKELKEIRKVLAEHPELVEVLNKLAKLGCY